MKRIAAIFLVISIPICCRDNEFMKPSPYKPPNDIREIIPTAVGLSWHFNRIGYREMPFEPFDTSMMKRSIIGWDHSNDTPYVAYRDSFYSKDAADLGEYEDYHSLITKDRYITYHGLNFSQGTQLLRAPIEKGNSWLYHESDSSSGTVVITNPDTVISISGQTFEHAITLHANPTDDMLFNIDIFIVPQVGIVGERYIYRGGIFLELVSKNF